MSQTRRNFSHRLFGLSFTVCLPSFMYANNKVSNKISASILPKTSQAGTKIGLIALGYTFKKSTLKEAQNTLKQMGYKTDHTKRISKSFGYFSNTDEERAADINEMFANKKIDAIL